jgi:hypothetical protein
MVIVVLLAIDAIILTMYLFSRPKSKCSGIYLPDAFLFGIGIYAFGAYHAVFIDDQKSAVPVLEMGLLALGSGLFGATISALMFRKRYPESYFVQNVVNANSGPTWAFV